jgi:hypothetical protein
MVVVNGGQHWRHLHWAGSVQGHSRAGERTGFWIPELHIVLDGGMTTNKRVVAVLVSMVTH